ncbi:MAG: hypothetical protein H6Q80_1732, partial [Deltaproteobacteria bacterium]|nr:hypothetical protein [Deltaproteobacteria bacterium]
MRWTASPPVALLLVALLAQILAPSPAVGRDAAAELRKEKARLLEMKAHEEKAAAELTEALRKEKLTKGRVEELKGRLAAQKRTISRIDRKIASLSER